ncbi:hypothetical protein C0991_011646 [Blastosporella zonata]|nr:hypothetical protein C0991_011646 [Blastosporella zonata]
MSPVTAQNDSYVVLDHPETTTNKPPDEICSFSEDEICSFSDHSEDLGLAEADIPADKVILSESKSPAPGLNYDEMYVFSDDQETTGVADELCNFSDDNKDMSLAETNTNQLCTFSDNEEAELAPHSAAPALAQSVALAPNEGVHISPEGEEGTDTEYYPASDDLMSQMSDGAESITLPYTSHSFSALSTTALMDFLDDDGHFYDNETLEGEDL